MIRWEPYLWPQTPHATDEELAAVERAWGDALPVRARELIRAHQGESPEPGGLRVGGVPRTIECLLHARAGEHSSWRLVVVDAELRDVLPLGVHPFAATTSGTFVALDLRDGAAAVVHADLTGGDDHDDDDDGAVALRTVAADLDAFLAALHDPADPGPS